MSDLNLPRLIKLRDHLANLPASAFDLSTWFTMDGTHDTTLLAAREHTCGEALEGSCGTTACIAGHVLALFTPDEFVPENPSIDARHLLGLSYEQAGILFEPRSHGEDESASEFGVRDLPLGVSREDVTTAQAVQVLDHLIATGEVDWRIISVSQ